jgi:hypothetical protein
MSIHEFTMNYSIVVFTNIIFVLFKHRHTNKCSEMAYS